MKTSRVTAMVFWLKLVISLTQWVPTVRLKSAMRPLPHIWPSSIVIFPASGMRSAFPSVVIGMVVCGRFVTKTTARRGVVSFEILLMKNYEPDRIK